MRAIAAKRIGIYLAIAFGVPWLVLIIAGFGLGTFEVGENNTPAIIPIIAAIMFVPLLAALAANRLMGPHGSIDLGLKPRLKGNIPVYLVSWLAPAVLSLLGAALFFFLNPTLFDTSFSYMTNMMAASAGANADATAMPSQETIMRMLPMVVIAGVVYAPFINMIPAFGEEVGWRGMLFPSLCELMSPRCAALSSGAIWGLWHAPAMAMGHNYGMNGPFFPLANICTMVLACTALGVVMAALRARSNSVWTCSLAHGAINATANIAVVFCAAGQTLFGPSPLALVSGIPIFAVAIWCLARNRFEIAQPGRMNDAVANGVATRA